MENRSVGSDSDLDDLEEELEIIPAESSIPLNSSAAFVVDAEVADVDESIQGKVLRSIYVSI